MNLFKKNKRFEEKLQQQLNDMEVKPSLSLWDRIDSGIPQGGFEAKIKGQLDNFETIPNPTTWEKIEAELPTIPAKKISFRNLSLSILALLLLLGVYYTQSNLSTNSLNKTTATIPSKETYQPTIEKLVENKPLDKPITQVEQNDRSKTKPTIDKVSSFNGTSLKESFNNSSIENTLKEKKSTRKSKTKSTIAQAQQNNDKIETNSMAIVSEPTNAVVSSTPVKHNEPILNKEETILPDAVSHIVKQDSTVGEQNTPTIMQEMTATHKINDSLMGVKSPIHTTTDDRMPKFSISIYAGVNMCYTTYVEPKDAKLDFGANINFRKELERPNMDWSGGFLFDYRLNNKWMLSSGLMMVNFSQKFDYDITNAVTPANPNEVGAAVTNPNDSFTLGNTYSNRIKYSWNEIPLFINFNAWQKGKWNIDLQGGASYAFINVIDGGIVSYDNKGVLILKGKESFPYIKNTVYLTAMPQVSYGFGLGVSAGIVPTFKYSLTSIIGEDSWIQQHPYFIGLNICLRKRF